MRLALASSICMIWDWHSEMYSCVYWTCPSNIPITQFSSPISLSSCQQCTPWDYTLILANIMQGQRNHTKRNTTRHKEKRVFFKSVESCSYFALFDGYIPLTTELVQLFANTFPFLQQGTNKCMINSQNSDYHSQVIEVV